MIGFVYMWTNKLNGKKYIGLHVGSLEDKYIGSGVAFNRAIKKYGIEHFNRSILHEEYESEINLYQKEFDIITELDAVHSKDYYNLTNYDPKYVKFIEGKKTKIVLEETKLKMRLLKTGTRASEKTRQKMSMSRIGKKRTKKVKLDQQGTKNPQWGKRWYHNHITDGTFKEGKQPDGWVRGKIRGILKGANNPFYGKKHKKETLQLISEKNKGKLLGKNNPSKRPEVRAKISQNTTGKKKTRRQNENYI